MHKKTTDDGQLSLFEPAEEKIIKQEYSDIMKQSYIDYAMSVIIARAVPDILFCFVIVRDIVHNFFVQVSQVIFLRDFLQS